MAPEFDDYKYGVFKCKKDVQDELLYLKKLLEDCHSPLVFCHLDLNIPNILYDGSDVHFIDVEYAGPTLPLTSPTTSSSLLALRRIRWTGRGGIRTKTIS